MKTSVLGKVSLPVVYYMPKAWHKIQLAIHSFASEIGWVGLVNREDNNYFIEDIYVPLQEVSGTETDIDSDALAELTDELMAQNITPNLFYWGHSHVNMGTSPSKQDDDQMEELMQSPSLSYMLRGIYNKKGEINMSLYHFKSHILYDEIKPRLWLPPLDEAEAEAFKEVMKENVQPARAVIPYAAKHWYNSNASNAWPDKTSYYRDISQFNNILNSCKIVEKHSDFLPVLSANPTVSTMELDELRKTVTKGIRPKHCWRLKSDAVCFFYYFHGAAMAVDRVIRVPPPIMDVVDNSHCYQDYM